MNRSNVWIKLLDFHLNASNWFISWLAEFVFRMVTDMKSDVRKVICGIAVILAIELTDY